MPSDNGPRSRADFLTENSMVVYGTVRAKIIKEMWFTFKGKVILVPKSAVMITCNNQQAMIHFKKCMHHTVITYVANSLFLTLLLPFYHF